MSGVRDRPRPPSDLQFCTALRCRPANPKPTEPSTDPDWKAEHHAMEFLEVLVVVAVSRSTSLAVLADGLADLMEHLLPGKRGRIRVWARTSTT